MSQLIYLIIVPSVSKCRLKMFLQSLYSPWKQIYTKKYYAVEGIVRELFIMSFYNMVKPSILSNLSKIRQIETSITNKMTDNDKWERSNLLLGLCKISRSFKLYRSSKNLDNNFLHIPHILLILLFHIIIYFDLYKII